LESKPIGSSGNRDAGGFLVQLGAFLALVVAVDFRLVRHFGVSIEHAVALGGAAGLIPTVFGWFSHALTKGETRAAKTFLDRVQRLPRYLIAPRTLAILYSAAILVGLGCSSVQLAAPNNAETLSIGLHPLGAPKASRRFHLRSGTELITLRVVTTPFGRPYLLDVEGRLPCLVRVPPFTGAVVSLDEDLKLAPTVLLRLPPEASTSLSDTNWVSIWKGTKQLARAFLPGEAFHLGAAPRIRDQQLGEWRGDLILAATEDAKRMEHYLRAWRQSTPFSASYQPTPGDSLRVEVCTDAGMRVVEGRFLVTADELVDVLLSHVSKATPCGS
jgi:hypothetical protein